MRNTHRILLAAASCLILAACAGADGKDGTNGTNGTNGVNGTNGANGVNGTNGTNGTNGVNGVAGKLRLTIDSVVTEADKSKSTLTFTVYPAANVCPGAICDDTLSSAVVGTKTFYATEYNTATKDFDTAKSFSFGSVHFKGFSADGNGATYTATKTSPTWAPEASTSAFIYAYVTGLGAVPVPSTGHYLLPTSVASAAKVYGAVPYTSSANASGCEKCHGAPYAKHGYRMANVAGLNEMVACKACHTDQRPGSDANWYMIADDPANYVANVLPSGSLAPAYASKYAYTANLMNDTHNSHAFEFNYPQSMANCVTCHAGKLASIITDENFKPTVCKSCHPVNGPAPTDAGANGGVEAGRAPSLAAIFLKHNVAPTVHGNLDLYHSVDGGVDVTATQCNQCHKAGGIAPTFAQLHSGLDDQIYFDGGTRWSDVVKTTIGATSYNPDSGILTVPFTVTGAAANAIILPTVVGGLYGWGTKDFVVSGHSSNADGGRVLEYAEGSTSNHVRLSVNPAVTTAGTTSWTATADLSNWFTLPDGGPGLIPNGTVQRVQISVLPSLGINQAVAPGSTNPQVSISGATATITLVQNGTYAPGSVDPTGYGQDIVDSKKCNACHDRLATTFHGPNYGSAGIMACRTCHWAGAGGAHLEMQSRSIDSYVHAIHRMQYFDIRNVNFKDPVQALRYGDHVEGNYPNFAGPLNCESCHNAGKYNPPAQNRSLPGLISAGATLFTGNTRAIQPVPAQITGPAERACGGCHRAVLINEDDASGLAVFYAHTTVNGTTVLDTTQASLDAVDNYIMGQVGVMRPAPAAVAGAQVESCGLCHGRAGDEHQQLFNTWKKGLQ